MIVVRITGGLGNQMFQYAFARSLQAAGQQVFIQWHGHRTKSRHNGWELDSVFETRLSSNICLTNRNPALNLLAWSMRKACRTREPADMSFNPSFLKMKSGYLDGYWQTEKYFSAIADRIRSDFRFKPLTGTANIQLQTTISSIPCVSIHVRRGDYISHSGLGGICTSGYYQQALTRMESMHPGCTPVIFSDDVSYCRELFAKHHGVIYCDWNHGANSWMDMSLMSQCTHHIIANSSFSWWGAWLGGGDVAAPENWFHPASDNCNRDIYPKHWTLLPADGSEPKNNGVHP